jgi:DNA-directed RNA polymerase specialized sigma24 family protein
MALAMVIAGNHSGGSTLVRSAVAGDPEALGRLLSRLTDQLYYAAFRVLNSLGEAEDAVQDGLLAATGKLKTFEGRPVFHLVNSS